MPEKPIIMSGPMVRAYFDGLKTQTRRIMKPQPEYRENKELEGHYGHWFHGWNLDIPWAIVPQDILDYCPYGSRPGDSIWWRETWAHWLTEILYRASSLNSYDEYGNKIKWKPSIHMPREACRIVTPLTGVRYERLQDISRGDCMSEGCPFPNMEEGPDPRKWYADLWDGLNSERGHSWDTNPWVWVLEFPRYEESK